MFGTFSTNTLCIINTSTASKTTPEDSLLIQADLTRLADWSRLWKLQLNPSKSFTITLTRRPVINTYTIQNDTLETVSSIRDLGVWLDSKLTFAEHIDKTVSKANRMLGVMIRSLQTGHAIGQASSRSKFKFKPEPVLAAYHANVRSIFEYGCIIWGGAAKTHLERLDRIQHKFIIWLASRSTQRYQNIDYDHLLGLFKIPSLSMRRLQYDILFVHKIVSGMIDSTFLLGNFPLHVPARTTRAIAHTLFHVPFHLGLRRPSDRVFFVARPNRSTNFYQQFSMSFFLSV